MYPLEAAVIEIFPEFTRIQFLHTICLHYEFFLCCYCDARWIYRLCQKTNQSIESSCDITSSWPTEWIWCIDKKQNISSNSTDDSQNASSSPLLNLGYLDWQATGLKSRYIVLYVPSHQNVSALEGAPPFWALPIPGYRARKSDALGQTFPPAPSLNCPDHRHYLHRHSARLCQS